MTELARDMEDLCNVLGEPEPGGLRRVKAMVSRLAEDSRYAEMKPVFEEMEAEAEAQDWMATRELATLVFNAAWERSKEYDVGRDAFIRRIRGCEFKTLSYADPLTSDRGAALARIMQGDPTEAESLPCERKDTSRLIIELAGDFEIVRLSKDWARSAQRSRDTTPVD